MKHCIKRICSLIMAVMMFASIVQPVYAEQKTVEWYNLEVIEAEQRMKNVDNSIQTRGTLISTVTTRIVDKGDGVVWMNADVHCQQDMEEIKTIFYLQRLEDGTWTTVGSITVTVEDAHRLDETVKATNVPDGTYRAKTSSKATLSSGQSETIVGYSGIIVIDNN